MIPGNKNSQLEYLRTRRSMLLLYALIGLIQSCAIFLLPVSIGEFFTIFFNSDSSKGRLLQMLGIHIETLSSFLYLFLLLLLTRAIFEFLEKWFSYRQGELYVQFIRERLFAAQINWSPERFQQKHFGKYLLRYSSDMRSLQQFLTKGIMGCLKDVSFLIVGFGLLWIIHRTLTIYLLLLTVTILLFTYLLSSFQKKLIRSSRDKRSILLAHTARSFERHTSIKASSREEKTIARFNAFSRELLYNNMKNNRFDSLLHAMLPMLQYMMIGILLWLMTFANNTIPLNDALVYILIILLMLVPMKRVLKVPAIINKGKLSLVKINEALLPEKNYNQLINN